MYPVLEINLSKIRHNIKVVKELCNNNGIELMAVTKGFRASENIIRLLVDEGVTSLGDSRIKNIEAIRNMGLPVEITLIKIPGLSEVKDVVRLCDYSVNSEVEVIKALSQEAVAQNKVHKIILMVDVGDLREGVMPTDVESTVNQIKDLEGVKLVGLGSNVGCFGGVMPSKENSRLLVELSNMIQSKFDIKIDILSGGATCNTMLIVNNEMPEGINQLRVGTAFLMGENDVCSLPIEGCFEDAFILKTEVIELKEKPSVPIGNIGTDAFGNKPFFEERGSIKRAIVGVGKQDLRLETVYCTIEGVDILGGSSDHLILDISKSKEDFFIGKEITFNMGYGGMLSLFISDYVEKKFV